MLSTIALVVAGLSTSHKIGLVVVGAAFIIFALICSFVLPRRNPDFPGKHIGLFVTVAVCFFVAMLAAVIIFGREAPEASGESGATTTATATTPSTSTPTTSTTASSVAGDPAAGKAVFASAGCTGCHTLKAAGATGTVGPNLDDLKPSEDAVKNQVIHGGGAMPPFGGSLSATQIQNVAAFVYVSTHS